MKKHYRSDKSCLNCNTTVTDKFCPACGQENLELHEDFLHVVFHSIGHYFHFESKFFNSLVPLFTKPGFLTQEYFAGKRASHLNPISMYIFISLLFFFLFTLNSNSNKKDIIKENAAETAASTAIDKASITDLDSAKTAAYTILKNVKAAADKTEAHNDAVIFTNPDAAEVTPANSTKAVTDDLEDASLVTKLRQVMDDDMSSELFKNKLMSHLPKVMFILLPLFALILMLVNYRSSKYYVEHLIYSIHVHSFLFLFVSILILLSWIMPFLEDWLQWAGVLIVLWYIYRSLRNFYGSRRWRTIYKFFVLFLAYSFLLIVSSFVVVVATLYTM